MEYNYAAYPIIPDSVNEIAEEVRTFCERFNFVPQNSMVVGAFEKNDMLPSGRKMHNNSSSPEMQGLLPITN